jgi:hypothetical protein
MRTTGSAVGRLHSRRLTAATENSFCAASRQHPTPVKLAQIGGSGADKLAVASGTDDEQIGLLLTRRLGARPP